MAMNNKAQAFDLLNELICIHLVEIKASVVCRA